MKIIPRYTQQISLISFFRALFIRKIGFPENYLFFNSGRGAIKWLLSQLKLHSGRKLKVGMPCYACYTVFQGVSESENSTVLLDLDPFSFFLTSRLQEEIKKLDVLLWIDYFGFKYSNVLKEIRERFPDLIILEDCSQVDLRDYMNLPDKECFADYTIFSFNFRKPITAGGGGLLVLNKVNDKKASNTFYDSYRMLPFDKMSLNKLIHILIYNFSYNSLVFPVFNRLIARRRGKEFLPEEVPVHPMNTNPFLKRMFYTQFLKKADREKSVSYTLNYFNRLPDMQAWHSFGAMSYYPVLLSTFNPSAIDSVDKFMLWDNLVDGYSYFGINVSDENFPLTFKFMSQTVFLPAVFFKEPNEDNTIFPGGLQQL